MLHDRLEVVFILRGHSNLISLDGGLNFHGKILYNLHDLFSFLLRDSLRQSHFLAETAIKSFLGGHKLQRLLGNLPASKPCPENVLEIPQFHIIIRDDLDLLFILQEFQRAFAPLEIKTGRELFFGLVHSIVDFLEIDL